VEVSLVASLSTSVNTNLGAISALASLRKINAQLQVANKQLETGYRVADAADDASTFSVAQGLRGDLQAFSAVQGSLANGVGLASVTQAALTSISDTAGNIQAKLVQLSDASITAGQRAIYTADYNALTSQISNFIGQANYNGANLISAGSAARTYLASISGSTLSLSSQASTSTAFTTFTGAVNVSTASDATAALTPLTTFQTAISSSLASNSGESRGLTVQSGFVNAISDAVTTGLGVLVDADIGKAAAQSQSLQVRQQLAVQSLSIANQQPGVLLGLFNSGR
jgi:flagellin